MGHALRLAATFDSTLVALYVVDIRILEGPLLQTIGTTWGAAPIPAWQEDVAGSLRESGRQALDEVAGRARAAGRPVETELEIGLPAETIVERARTVDLIVLGRRGEHAAFGSHPLGSAVQGVVRQAGKPVLVCPQGEHPLGPALAAYDGSEHARRALEIAVRYVERVGTELGIVTVHSSREEAERRVEEGAAYAHGHGLAPSTHVREGNHPADMILEVAR